MENWKSFPTRYIIHIVWLIYESASMNHYIKLSNFGFSSQKQFCVGVNVVILIPLKLSWNFLSFGVHIVISRALESSKSINFKKSTFFDFGRIFSNFLEVFVRPHNSKQLSFIWNHFYSDWSNLRWDFVLASFEIFKNKNRIITWHLNVTWPHIRFLWTIFDPLSDETEILNIRRLFGFLRF